MSGPKFAGWKPADKEEFAAFFFEQFAQAMPGVPTSSSRTFRARGPVRAGQRVNADDLAPQEPRHVNPGAVTIGKPARFQAAHDIPGASGFYYLDADGRKSCIHKSAALPHLMASPDAMMIVPLRRLIRGGGFKIDFAS